MNSKNYYLIIIGLIWNSGFAQQLIELDIKNKKIDYYINLEKKLRSTPYISDETYIAGGDVAQPVIFLRKEKNLPDLLVYYTYFKKDSILSEINYEWDVYNFDKKDNNIKTLDFEKNLIKKYIEIADLISKEYGKSATTGNLDDLSKINTSEGLKRADNWAPNDSLKINMYTTISNYYHKEGIVTTNPTHRIRLYIKNLRKKKSEQLSNEKLNLLDTQFKRLIALLESDNYKEVIPLLSDKIKSTVTPEILKKFKDGLQINRKLELYMNGIQIMQDGNSYPMLQFKYKGDIASPPKEYVKVIFDTDNTILALQPLRQIK